MKTIAPIIIVLTLLACAGCATRYDITLTNGTVINAKGRPHYDPDRGIWTYTNASGKPAKIPAGSVTEVAPSSMAGSDQPKFTSTLHRQ